MIPLAYLDTGRIFMANQTLTFRTAEKHIRNYNSETSGVIAAHREAMECWDCQAFLQLGIDAFRWLVLATKEFRTNVPKLSPELIVESEEMVRQLRKSWLEPCGCAEEWIAIQRSRNYEVSNLEEFRECCQKVRQMVTEDQKMQQLAKQVPSMEDLASIAVDPPKEWTDEPSWSQ